MSINDDEDSPKQASSTGRAHPIVDMTDWRQQMVKRRVKFDDEQKKIFLEEYARTGLKVRSAKAAGVVLNTVNNHAKLDPHFAEAMDEAWETRCAHVRGTIEADAMEGFERRSYDKDGNLIREERVYETQIRAMMLKRHDPEYRDRLDMNVAGAAGGVLVIPVRLSMEEWEALYSPKDEPPSEESILE